MASSPSELATAEVPVVTRGASAPVRSRVGNVSDRALALAAGVGVVAATALALWLRLVGLPGWDGTLSIDEARLALAGRGVLEHGLPVMPSGWLYTRGLLSSYAVAASFGLLGESDFAARLPSVLAGTVLVPVMYLLGREVGGRAGGLFAAFFVAAYPPLVAWSRQAWFYALYVVLFAAALLFIARAHRRGFPRDQILAGALVGLSLFAHELGIFLLVPLVVQVAMALRGPGARGLWLLVSLGIAIGAAALLGLLTAGLRADTLAGRYGEVREYWSPHLDPASFRFYGGMLFDTRGLVLLAALAGVPLVVARRSGLALLLWLALVPPFLHAAAIIPERPEERYGLTVVVVLVVLAAQSVGGWATWAVRRFPFLGVSSGPLAGLALAAILAAHLDVGRAIERGRLPPESGAWLVDARALGIGLDDLVMSDLPTVAGWYVGGLDAWPRSRAYQKYTLAPGEPAADSEPSWPRDVHTGAVLVRDVGEFQRRVARPNRGRTLWVLASGRTFHWDRWIDDDLKRLLERSASSRTDVADGSRILRIDL